MDEILQKQSDILSILPDRKYLQKENAFPVIPATEVREHSWTYHAKTEMLPFSQHRKIAYPIAIPIVFSGTLPPSLPDSENPSLAQRHFRAAY